jgi:hypothetical protein
MNIKEWKTIYQSPHYYDWEVSGNLKPAPPEGYFWQEFSFDGRLIGWKIVEYPKKKSGCGC